MYAEIPVSDNPVPSVQAILLCEKIIEEAGSGKKSLINIFNEIMASSLPVVLRMGLYARMTDAEGRYGFRVDLVHLPSDKKIGAAQIPADVADRLRLVEVVIHMPQIVFPEFGKYEFQLYGDDVFLGHVSVDVLKQGA